MSNPTENPTPSAQDDIKTVLQDTLIQQVSTLLNFSRTATLQLQVPDQDLYIFAGPRTRIAEFIEREIVTPAASFTFTVPSEPGTYAVDGSGVVTKVGDVGPLDLTKAPSARDQAIADDVAALASQSQAAQPAIKTWQERCGDTGPMPSLDQAARAMKAEIAELRAHIAGTSQATLQDNEQCRLQMAAISTAAVGYWTEEEGIKPEYDTVPLRDVAKLYAKYAALYESQATKAQAEPSAKVIINDGNGTATIMLAPGSDLKVGTSLYVASVAKEAPAVPEGATNCTLNGGDVDGNQVFVSMDNKPSTHLWTVGGRAYLYEAAPQAPATREAKDEQQANELMRKALEDIAQPADAGCGCSFPCQCNSDGAEVINAGVMRDIAADALAEVGRLCCAQREDKNADSSDVATTTSTVSAPEDDKLRAEYHAQFGTAWMHGGKVGGTIPTFEAWKAERALKRTDTGSAA